VRLIPQWTSGRSGVVPDGANIRLAIDVGEYGNESLWADSADGSGFTYDLANGTRLAKRGTDGRRQILLFRGASDMTVIVGYPR